MHRAGVDNTSTFETRAGHILGAPPQLFTIFILCQGVEASYLIHLSNKIIEGW